MALPQAEVDQPEGWRTKFLTVAEACADDPELLKQLGLA